MRRALAACALALGCAGAQHEVAAPAPATSFRAPPAASDGAEPVPAAAAPSSTATGQRLMRGDGSPADAELGLADAAYEQDDLTATKLHLEKAKQLAPGDPAPELGLLRVALDETGIPTAFAAAENDARLEALLVRCDALVAKAPRYGLAHAERARLLLMLGRGEPALEALARAIELLPNDPEIQASRGVALIAVGRSGEALPYFSRAAELAPGSAEHLTNLGTVQLLLGRVDDAVATFERARDLAPDSARAHSDLGTAYLAQNRADRAVPELERAVALDAARATFRSNLAYAYELDQKIDLAIATARKAVELDPALGSAWINLGTALSKKGERREAESAFRRALALDPSDPRAKQNIEELGSGP